MVSKRAEEQVLSYSYKYKSYYCGSKLGYLEDALAITLKISDGMTIFWVVERGLLRKVLRDEKNYYCRYRLRWPV